MDIDVVRESWQAVWTPPSDACASLTALCVVSCDGRILHTNSTFRRTVDLTEGNSFADAFVEPEAFHKAAAQTVRDGRLPERELALRGVVGTRWISSAWRCHRGDASAFLEIAFVDITDRRRAIDDRDAARIDNERLAAQLRDVRDAFTQAESAASLGRLVAGITHEVCTPLGIGVTAATHLAEQVDRMKALFEGGTLRRADMADFLSSASEATRLLVANLARSDELIQSFKKVAVDRTSGVRRSFALKPYFDEILFTLRPHLKRNAVSVAVDCPADLTMDSFPGALSQVITNLVVNAVVHAYGTASAAKVVRLSARAKEQNAVVLTISDEGVGIAPENLVHIFEPYFTTRWGEGGSGLGLHIVRSTVTRTLGGTIEVDSALEKGTRFTLTLPREAPLNPPTQRP